jgi:hypothetical protein
MEQSPSWVANRHSAGQEISRLLCNPKVYFRVHKSPLVVHIRSQIHPVHNLPTCLFKIQFNIIPI